MQQDRILYVLNQYPKVSHTFIRREIKAIERLGIGVTRVALRGWNEEVVDPEDVEEKRLTHHLLKHGVGPLLMSTLIIALRKPTAFAKALALAFRLGWKSDRRFLLSIVTLMEAAHAARLAGGDRATHIHAHFGTNSAELAAYLSVLLGIPFSFTVHGPDEFDSPRRLKLREKVKLSRNVISISNFCSSQLFRWSDLSDWEKIKIVPCGLDLAASHAPSSDAEMAPNRFVAVGRLSAQKGHLLLVKAAAELKRQGVVVEIVFVGDGELRSEVEAAIAREQLTDRISITGWADEERVRREIAAARALLLPSFAEGLPIVIMEAFMAGRPVIATEIAAIPELVREGETGWLVPPGSVEAFVQAIKRCLETSDDDCRLYARTGRQLVEARHDIDGSARALANLFMHRRASR